MKPNEWILLSNVRTHSALLCFPQEHLLASSTVRGLLHRDWIQILETSMKGMAHLELTPRGQHAYQKQKMLLELSGRNMPPN